MEIQYLSIFIQLYNTPLANKIKYLIENDYSTLEKILQNNELKLLIIGYIKYLSSIINPLKQVDLAIKLSLLEDTFIE